MAGIGLNKKGKTVYVPDKPSSNAKRVKALESALKEIVRRTELLIHQNTGRWDMTLEHDRRSYNISQGNIDIANKALKGD